MSVTEFLLRSVRRISFLRSAAEVLIRFLVSKEKPRSRLNRFFNRLNIDEKAIFQNLACKVFTNREGRIDEGIWAAEFSGREIKMPLRNESIWLDWDNAVSITGHDFEVKSTYEELIRSEFRPRVFFDIGANYGTHSLLFLRHDIRTVTFEPNPACVTAFEELCRLNGFDGEAEKVAVGDRNEIVGFWFPTKHTWLGTMVDSTRELLSTEHELEKIEVRLITVDSYAAQRELKPDLIKIDTEGNELNVVRGAISTIRTAKPLIIFEANQLSDRADLWDIFLELEYAICELPIAAREGNRPLAIKEFIDGDGFNFMALPLDHEFIRQPH